MNRALERGFADYKVASIDVQRVYMEPEPMVTSDGDDLKDVAF